MDIGYFIGLHGCHLKGSYGNNDFFFMSRMLLLSVKMTHDNGFCTHFMDPLNMTYIRSLFA